MFFLDPNIKKSKKLKLNLMAVFIIDIGFTIYNNRFYCEG